jgi:hypothetical protein
VGASTGGILWCRAHGVKYLRPLDTPLDNRETVCNLLNNGGRACKPDFVPQASLKAGCCAAIIPLDHGSRRDSSSLPEGCSLQRLAPSQRERIRCGDRVEAVATRTLTRRAGPALPSYLALHHAGFSVPRVLPPERWALTPPFHPCQTKRAVRRRLAGLPARCHRAACRRRFIFCGTFRERTGRHRLRPVLPRSLPWRYQARRPLP